MKRVMLYFGLLLMLGVVSAQTSPPKAARDSMEDFWQRFQTAVVKGDKQTVAALAGYPVSVPYGIKPIRNKTQFLRNYKTIFFFEANAAKCFPKAKPDFDTASPNEFSVACSIGGPDTPLVYMFTRGRNGWRFTGLDNINE
ncbi:MAG TPA: hypothetical protein VJT50_03890 [Pyrinomonadaceae bacterium]|nr:hypothetical protein [Pyrinomonadaceae bacterium]